MAIQTFGNGGFMVTGPQDVNLYRLLTLKKGLELEIRTGMQLTRGPSASARIKKEFGLRGNKQRVLDQFLVIVEQAKASRDTSKDTHE